MEWFIKLMQNPESLAHLVILYALVISLGVRLGRWRIGGKNGIAFGVTWVLFVGILVGHICTHYLYADPVAAVAGQKHVIDMVKELGLILFVYCIGLQVGPSFFQTFKSGGLGMNMLTLSLVLLNVAVMIGLYFLATALGIFDDPHSPNNLPMMVGVLYGAVTNTPGLGAANNVLPDLMTGVKDVPVIANGYACAYPLGVVGIILATIAVRFL
ncbi:MAG: transporter, partial [Prevotellaceae bacterium]|nr:transporter [Prevotellaceae bacterium]